MTPEQLVAKIVVSYNSINSVYRTRELEDKAFDVDYIIEVGSTNAINLHHTKHLHNGEQYLTSIIGMLHELNAPISQYINAELPALEEIVDNAVKITKRENLRGIKDQLTILQGSLKDAKQSRKNNLKALKELNNVLKGLKSTMDKFTAKTPHQSDEALKNFKLMQDYLDKINNLIEEGKQKDAAIEKITAEINEVETQIASLQGEIDGLEDTCTEVIKQTKLYEGEMRVIYAGIQDLIEQHKADLIQTLRDYVSFNAECQKESTEAEHNLETLMKEQEGNMQAYKQLTQMLERMNKVDNEMLSVDEETILALNGAESDSVKGLVNAKTSKALADQLSIVPKSFTTGNKCQLLNLLLQLKQRMADVKGDIEKESALLDNMTEPIGEDIITLFEKWIGGIEGLLSIQIQDLDQRMNQFKAVEPKKDVASSSTLS